MTALFDKLRSIKLLRYIRNIVAVSLIIWFAVILSLAVLIFTQGDVNEARPSDVIIVLGSGLRRDGEPGDALFRRAVWASRLYADGIAGSIICTGGVGRKQVRSESSGCRDVLLAQGVPDEDIYIEERSQSTEENAIFAREIMEHNGWRTVTLVTDSFHMLRASWIFDIQSIAHYPSAVPREWVRSFHYGRHFAREILALHWQAFKITFDLPQTSVEFL